VNAIMLILIGYLIPPSWACSCASRTESGFLHTGVQQLPSNAKGVLFYISPTELYYQDQPQKKFRPPAPKDFSVKDMTTQQVQVAKLERLSQVDHEILGYAGMKKYLNTTELQSVEQSSGLFRIEVEGGFTADHKYSFEYLGKAVHPDGYHLEAKISGAAADLKSLQLANYAAVDSAKFQDLTVMTVRGSCAIGVKAAVQRIKFRPAIDSNSVLVFNHVRKAGGEFKTWEFRSSLCEPASFGQVANWTVFRKCSVDKWQDDFSDEIIDEAYATWGFFELEDKLYTSEILKLDFSKALAGHCS